MAAVGENQMAIDRRLRPNNWTCERAENDRAPATLRNTVVGHIYDAAIDEVAALSRRGQEQRELGGLEQLRNVFHEKDRRSRVVERSEILPPKRSALQPNAVAVEGRESLTGRATHQDVRLREVADGLDQIANDRDLKIEDIRLDCVSIDFNRPDRCEPSGRVEPGAYPATPGKEVKNPPMHLRQARPSGGRTCVPGFRPRPVIVYVWAE